MRRPLLLLTALLSVTLLAAQAQTRHGAAYYLRHPAGADARPGLPAPAGSPAPAPIPSALTAAAPAQPPLADVLPPAPRFDATGVQPLYDLYGKLPEDFRRHTLPAAYVEPLPVRLLRGLLGR